MFNNSSKNSILFFFLKPSFLLCWLLLFTFLIPKVVTAQDIDQLLQKRITLPKQRTTIYQALNQLTDSIGYFFAYNSKVVQSDKRIRLNQANVPLKEALHLILNDTTLLFELIDKHILIYQDSAYIMDDDKTMQPAEETDYLTVKGRVIDSDTHQPIAYAAIGIPKYALGNVTNLDGIFVLKIPKKFAEESIQISHVGYKSKKIPINLLKHQLIDIFLTTEFISIQEVLIRNIDPKLLVKEALTKIPDNYTNEPIYLNAFYREGVIKNEKFLNYSEAIFKIYKPSYSSKIESDQVKLLKSRKSQNIDHTDTLNIKLRGGVGSSLTLDIVKNYPSFLDFEYLHLFNFYRRDIVTIGERLAYEIGFEQKEITSEPLFKGIIYIDIETLAILSAEFEINPKYIKSATSQYLYKRVRRVNFRPVSIKYSVRYSEFNGRLRLSHVRGDLRFKYRQRRSLFYNPFHTFFELAVSQADTLNVERFSRREVATTTNVFFEHSFKHDVKFWRDFNYIAPESNLLEMLEEINAKIEEISQK